MPTGPETTRDPVSGERLAADALETLHANGAESHRTRARADQLSSALGEPIELDLGWNRSEVTAASGSRIVFRTPPSNLGMNRVLAVDRAIDALAAGRTDPAAAYEAVRRAAALPAANLALFVLACAAGASCLAVIFGVRRWEPIAVIVVSAALGAVVRRLLGRAGASPFWQVGAAALIASVLGAAAVDMGFSSELRLAVVCPCMILVPGPHLLNGAFDLAGLRIPLGVSRLTFAAVTLLSIGAGLVIGLTIGGANLIPEPGGREVPVLLDAVAAGVVAVCYGVFYSAPVRILYWPLLVGGAVHALRWTAITVWHWDSALAAALACLLAAGVLLPASRRFGVPFAAVGFASVVSLMPGVLIFRVLDGLTVLQRSSGEAAQRLLVEIVQDATEAGLTVFGMAVGILIPAFVYNRIRAARGTGS
ncbi:hypothetical protein LLS1_11010 [Leifsonia sp. LS1]|uniref:threonine/serine ThrE exporter family protein n=1 Tax=Leifsonia sp. LS1 TaxID=2828483 RepID=UPI001CFD73AA|nr:threonine/serine exporter family protein [Leifsonia sp. LS1]GIT79432.1 hypothetical protein LLS1_11010 [Leifsonia sp. LS1]